MELRQGFKGFHYLNSDSKLGIGFALRLFMSLYAAFRKYCKSGGLSTISVVSLSMFGVVGCADLDTGQVDESNDLADVLRAEHLIPGGDLYMMVVHDQDSGEICRQTFDMQLEQTSEALEKHTAVRLHLIDDPSEALNGIFYEFTPICSNGSGGESNLGTLVQIDGDSKRSVGHTTSRLGSINHEIGHGFGLKHEHTREDAVEYVSIYPDSIPEDSYEQNYLKDHFTSSEDIGKWDHMSAMLYSSARYPEESCYPILRAGAPSNCGEEAKPYRIQNYEHFSQWDYTKLTALYCLPKFCGENCASEERCDNLETIERYKYWEKTGEAQLPGEDPAYFGLDPCPENWHLDMPYCRENVDL